MKMKNKLLATAVMLVISIIMMSTASFAWFTISTAPEVKGLTSTVVTNENLEIALSGTTLKLPSETALGDEANTTWGNLVDLSTLTSLDKTLRPAKLESGVFKYPTYGEDGRPETTLSNLVLDTTYQSGNLTDSATNGKIYGYYVDVWVRSNVAGAVTLADADTNVSGATDSREGLGAVFTTTNEVLASNVKVAVQVVATASADGTVTDTTSSTTITNAITEMTMGTATAGTGDAADTYTTTIDGTVTTLVANEAQLVRIYVYLDGTNVTNAAASITGTTIEGALNLQFTNNAAKSMDHADVA